MNNFTRDKDSTFSIIFEIYDRLGGEKPKKTFDSVYSELKAIVDMLPKPKKN